MKERRVLRRAHRVVLLQFILGEIGRAAVVVPRVATAYGFSVRK